MEYPPKVEKLEWEQSTHFEILKNLQRQTAGGDQWVKQAKREYNNQNEYVDLKSKDKIMICHVTNSNKNKYHNGYLICGKFLPFW